MIRIHPGDSVAFEINEVMSWQVSKKSTARDFLKLDLAKIYPLTGPVYIEGASPGDSLLVTVEEIETADWGWTAIMPGLGLLPEFKKPYLRLWDLSKAEKKGYVEFKNKIRVPYRPFCGVMGVAPKHDGEFNVAPPGVHGGNMDIKNLVKGAVLELPICRKGALFSVGDLHAAQGDGEVCLCAIECPGKVKLKFDILKRAKLSSPRYTTPTKNQWGPEFVTTGISPDLMEGSRIAVRDMIDYLSSKFDLTKEEAYVLCSVAGELRIHEIVDAPNWLVGFAISNSILPS